MTADPPTDPAAAFAAAVNTGVAETLIADALLHHSWCTVDRGHCTCRPNRLTDARAVLATPLLRDLLALRGRVTALADELGSVPPNELMPVRHAAVEIRAALNPQAGS